MGSDLDKKEGLSLATIDAISLKSPGKCYLGRVDKVRPSCGDGAVAINTEDAPEDPAPLLELCPILWGQESRCGFSWWAVETMEPHHLDQPDSPSAAHRCPRKHQALGLVSGDEAPRLLWSRISRCM